MQIEPKIQIENLVMQEEVGDRLEVSVELRFDRTPEILILQDGSYEHSVEVDIDHSTGKVWLRERPLDYPQRFNPEHPGRQWSYRNEILLFDSCHEWDESAETASPAEPGEPYIDVLMNRGPSPHGDFVEVEDPDGGSIHAGEWIDRGNGLWALRLRARDITR